MNAEMVTAIATPGLGFLGDVANIAIQLYALKEQKKMSKEYNRLMGEQYGAERAEGVRQFDESARMSRQQLRLNERAQRFGEQEAGLNRLERKKTYDRDTVTGFANWMQNSMQNSPSMQLKAIQLWGGRR
jgi:hypothetical protein